jgi:hypothetical protein
LHNGDPDEIMAATERFRNRPGLVSWLSQLREMQMEQMKVHKPRTELANAVLDSLNSSSEHKSV